jgi:hypothetical protein
MPDAETMSAIAPYLSGPGAAVVVLLAVLAGLYSVAVRHFVPLVAALGKRHLDQIDSLLLIQREESKVITKTLSSIDRRLARIEDLTDGGRLLVNAGAGRPDSLAG